MSGKTRMPVVKALRVSLDQEWGQAASLAPIWEQVHPLVDPHLADHLLEAVGLEIQALVAVVSVRPNPEAA